MAIDPIMPTGLFAGRRVSRLPSAYLRLLLGTAQQLQPYLRSAIAAEMHRRHDAEAKRNNTSRPRPGGPRP